MLAANHSDVRAASTAVDALENALDKGFPELPQIGRSGKPSRVTELVAAPCVARPHDTVLTISRPVQTVCNNVVGCAAVAAFDSLRSGATS